MDFAEFTLGFGESGVECGNRIGWTVEMCGSVDHFQWESLRYELQTGSRIYTARSMNNNRNK